MKILLFVLAFMLACTHTSVTETTRASVVGPSIYPLAVALHDERGAPIALDVYRGHPVVVSMFYGSCPVACPLIVSHVKELEATLAPADREELRVLLVSFDPEHDTPEALSAIARARSLDLSRWTLATGTDDDVRQIAAALGVSYRAMPGGGFSHDSVLTVLDAEGRVRARTDDPNPDLAPLAAAVAAR